MRRIGWTFIDGHALLCDNGEYLDLVKDPPIVIADAVKRAVRGWRFNRIIDAITSIMPRELDICLGNHCREQVIDFTDVIGKLMSGKGGKCTTFELGLEIQWRLKFSCVRRSMATSSHRGGTKLV